MGEAGFEIEVVAAVAVARRGCTQSAAVSVLVDMLDPEAFLCEIAVEGCLVKPFAVDSAQLTRRNRSNPVQAPLVFAEPAAGRNDLVLSYQKVYQKASILELMTQVSLFF